MWRTVEHNDEDVNTKCAIENKNVVVYSEYGGNTIHRYREEKAVILRWA